MKKALRIFLALVVLGLAVTSGYVWGRRDGLSAEQNDILMSSTTTAQLIRENQSDFALRLAEEQIDYAALGLKQAQIVPSPVVVYKDIFTRFGYHNIPFQRSSKYINSYPHPKVSAEAVAYIKAQPDAEHGNPQ